MNDVISVRFRRDQVSVLNGNNCPLSAGISVRNRRNMHLVSGIFFFKVFFWFETDQYIPQVKDYVSDHIRDFSCLSAVR